MSERNERYGSDPAPCAVGDWIRFYHNGALVLDEVVFTQKNTIGYLQLFTRYHGTIDARYVVEYKR